MLQLIGCTATTGLLALIVLSLTIGVACGGAIVRHYFQRKQRHARTDALRPQSDAARPDGTRFDPLTGLANERHFEQLLGNAIALSERMGLPLAVLYIDLDQFDLVDEVLGTNLAEQIIASAARRLQAIVREMDTIGRVGRDKFVVVQQLASRPGDAAALADRMIAEMALPYTADHRNLVVTASAGVAVYPGDGTKPRKLIRHA